MNLTVRGSLILFVWLTLFLGFTGAQPLLQPDHFKVTNEDQNVVLDVLANDESNEELIITHIPLVNKGVATISEDGRSIRFTPQPGHLGMSYVKYTACNPAGECITQDANIFVYTLNLNATPVVDTLHKFIYRGDTTLVFSPFEAFTIEKPPEYGNFFRGQDAERFLLYYYPDEGFTGTDRLVFRFKQAFKRVIVIHVLEPMPEEQIAKDGILYLLKNTQSIQFNLREWLYAGNNTFSFRTVKEPELSYLLNYEDGIFEYYLPNDYEGIQYFEYEVCEGQLCETGRVFFYISDFLPDEELENHLVTTVDKPTFISYENMYGDFSIEAIPSNKADMINTGDWYFDLCNLGFRQYAGQRSLLYEPKQVGEDQFAVGTCVSNSSVTHCNQVDVRLTVLEKDDACCIEDCIWPGDMDGNGIVNAEDLLSLGWSIGAVGKTRGTNTDFSWFPSAAENWDSDVEGTDIKHHDADGDGILTQRDIEAIISNYGSQHQLAVKTLDIPSDLNLNIKAVESELDSGEMAILNVSLGDPTKPARDIHGITFSLQYEDLLVDDASLLIDYNDYSWLSDYSPTIQMTKSVRVGRVDGGLSRTNGRTAKGFGNIFQIRFIVIADVGGIKSKGRIPIPVKLTNVKVTDGSGLQKSLPDVETVVFLNLESENKDGLTADDVVVYPNPSSDRILVSAPSRTRIESVAISNLMGQEVYRERVGREDDLEIHLNHLVNGIYFMQLETNRGVVTKKFERIK